MGGNFIGKRAVGRLLAKHGTTALAAGSLEALQTKPLEEQAAYEFFGGAGIIAHLGRGRAP